MENGLCPLCLGKGELEEGEAAFDKKGKIVYSISRRVICHYCGGRGRGDFDVTPDQLDATINDIIRAQPRI